MHAIQKRSQRHASHSGFRQPPGSGLCQAEPVLPLMDVNLQIMHVNLHGYISHMAELEYHLRESQPDIHAITESLLDKLVAHVHLEGYTLISRLDRRQAPRRHCISRQEIN